MYIVDANGLVVNNPVPDSESELFYIYQTNLTSILIIFYSIPNDLDLGLSDWEKIKDPSTLNATLRLTNQKGQGIVIMRSPLYSSNNEVELTKSFTFQLYFIILDFLLRHCANLCGRCGKRLNPFKNGARSGLLDYNHNCR